MELAVDLHVARRPPPGALRPGAGVAGPPRPLLGGCGAEAVERLSRRPTSPARLAERLREEKRAASQEHRAHRLGPLVRVSPEEAGPLTLQAGRAARPARQGVASLPPSGQGALHPPRRLRRPAQGHRHLALLPGVGTPSGPPGDDGRPHSPLPALLLLAPAHRRPRLAPIVLVVFEDEIVQTTSCAWRETRWRGRE